MKSLFDLLKESLSTNYESINELWDDIKTSTNKTNIFYETVLKYINLQEQINTFVDQNIDLFKVKVVKTNGKE